MYKRLLALLLVLVIISGVLPVGNFFQLSAQTAEAAGTIIPYQSALDSSAVVQPDLSDISKKGYIIGNGELNAIVYSSGNDLYLRVSKNDFWDNRIDTTGDVMPTVDVANGTFTSGTCKAWGKVYPIGVNVGAIKLAGAAGQAAWSSAKLDLAKALVTVTSDVDTTNIRSLAQSNVFYINGGRTVTLEGVTVSNLPSATTGTTPNGNSYLCQVSPGDADVAATTVYMVLGTQGTRQAIAVVTSRESADPLTAAEALVQSVLAQTDTELVQAHESVWQDYWSKSGVQLGDEQFQRWWYRMSYYFRTFSKSGGNSVGLKAGFETAASWHNSLKLNYNTQQTYFSAGPINHPELLEPLIDTLNRNLKRAEWFARTNFIGSEGAFFHSDIWPFEPDPDTCVTNNKHQLAYMPWGYTWGMQGHIAFNLWEYYKYKPSTASLDKIYPLLKDFALFYCSVLEKCQLVDGKRKIGPSFFPENGSYGEYNVSYDIAFIKYALKAAKEAANLKNTDSDLVARIDTIMGQMPTYSTVADPNQFNKTVVEEWLGAGLLGGHGSDRHSSLTQAVFPAADITYFSSQADKDLFTRTINIVENKTTHANSNVMLNISRARLSLTNDAVSNAKMCFNSTNGYSNELPNGLFYWKDHGYYISEQVGIARLVTEFLMQSADDIIRVFPAWPTGTDAHFKGLLAQGGFEVSSDLVGGTITNLEIKSTVGGNAKLLNPWGGQFVRVVEQGSGTEVIYTMSNHIITFPTEAGKTYVVQQAASVTPESIVITNAPAKTSYVCGEGLNTAGLLVTAHYSNGVNVDLGETDYTVSGYDGTKAGTQTITVTYGGLTAAFDVDVKMPDSISITTPPTKLVYDYGEDLDTTGLQVTAHFPDGTQAALPGGQYTLSGYYKTKPGTQTVTVQYGSLTSIFNVQVLEPPVIVKNNAAGVTQSGFSTWTDSQLYSGIELYSSTVGSYIQYTFNGTGVQIIGNKSSGLGSMKVYIDGNVDAPEVDTYISSGTKLIKQVLYSKKGLSPGSHTVKLEVITRTASPNITKISFDAFGVYKNLTGFAVTTPPTKTVYRYGESLDTTGLALTATYGDGTTRSIPAGDCTISNYDKIQTGVQTVTVKYADNTATFDVTVGSKKLTQSIAVTTPPAKTTYNCGQSLDTTGLAVTANFSDGTSAALSGSDYTVSGYDKTKYGPQTVTVSYMGYTDAASDATAKFTAAFDVQTVDPEYILNTDPNMTKSGFSTWTDSGQYSGIELYSTTVGSYISYAFNGTGIEIIGNRNTGVGSMKVTIDDVVAAPEVVLYQNVSPGLKKQSLYKKMDLAPGPHTIKLEVIKQTTGGAANTKVSFDCFAVYRKLPVLAVIPPAKTVYNFGEDLDTTGLAVNATYSDGSTAALSSAQYTLSGYNKTMSGTQTVTITHNGGTATFNVTVGNDTNVTVTGVSLNKSTSTLDIGGTDTLVATVSPDNATNKNVAWSSSNSNIATVDSTGKVTAVTAGTATITVTTGDGGFTAACTVTVTEPVAAKPFIITSGGQLDRSGGIQASIRVGLTPGITTHDGQEVVVFQLMKGYTPVSIVALKRDITSQENFTAYFNVDPGDTSYKVRAYVIDSFSNDLTAPISLAEQVTLN